MDMRMMVLVLAWAFRPGSTTDDTKGKVSVLPDLQVAIAWFACGKVAQLVNA